MARTIAALPAGTRITDYIRPKFLFGKPVSAWSDSIRSLGGRFRTDYSAELRREMNSERMPRACCATPPHKQHRITFQWSCQTQEIVPTWLQLCRRIWAISIQYQRFVRFDGRKRHPRACALRIHVLGRRQDGTVPKTWVPGTRPGMTV